MGRAIHVITTSQAVAVAVAAGRAAARGLQRIDCRTRPWTLAATLCACEGLWHRPRLGGAVPRGEALARIGLVAHIRGIQARSESCVHSIWQVRTVAAASFRRQLWGRMAVLIRATQRQDVCGPSRIVETSESPRLILGARDNAPTRSALTLAGLNFTEVPRRLNRPLFHGLGRPR